MILLPFLDHSEGEKESTEGTSVEDEGRERPLISRQTSLKELPSTSRKSCEAIPEESKEVDGMKMDDPSDLHPHPRERVYTMPALNVQRRANHEPNPRRSLLSADPAQRDANATSGTNPRYEISLFE